MVQESRKREVESMATETGKIMYVVTSGECEDYNIEAIFDDKELAEKHLKILRKKDRNFRYSGIEKFSLNPEGVV